MALEIVPSIDLRGGKVVRLKQGDYAQQIGYDVDPQATAGAFAEAGARWMHIVDLDGAKEGRPVQTELIAGIIRSTGLKVQCGGGIRSTDDIRALLAAGANRVVVGTRAFEDWDWFNSLLVEEEFAHRLVLAVDAKEGFIATRGWTETTARQATDVAKEVSGKPLGALLYTDVAKDGMLQGPNMQHTRLLAEVSDVPVIASGGVGNIGHIRQLTQIPVWGVIVGRSLYEKTLDLKEAILVASKTNQSHPQ